MRVLHLCSTTLHSHYFRLLGSGLAEAGVDVVMGTLGTDPVPASRGGTGPRYFALGVRSPAGLPLGVLRLLRVLRRERPDLVQTHLFHAALVGHAAARLSGLPVVLTRHHTDEVALVGSRAHVLLDRYLCRHADRLAGLSDAVRRYAVEHDGVHPERACALRQGFDFATLVPRPGDVAQVRAELGLAGRFVIGCVARFFPTKGHAFLLEAFDRISRDLADVHLLLVGGGVDAPVRAAVRSRGLEGRVTFTGARPDVPALMGAMDVLVHPSETEAFCQVVVEAMAAGTPVIATTVGAAEEVIEDGRTGLLVPPRDPGAIELAVRRLHSAPAERAQIASDARAAVLGRFTVAAMVADQMQLYRAVVDGPAANRARR